MTFPSICRRAAVRLGVVCFVAAFALPSRADDPPNFSAPEVNDFVKRFAVLVDEYAKAVKVKDEKKLKDLDVDGKALQKLDATIEAKLTPEEREAFGKFVAAQAQKMMDAAQAATQ